MSAQSPIIGLDSEELDFEENGNGGKPCYYPEDENFSATEKSTVPENDAVPSPEIGESENENGNGDGNETENETLTGKETALSDFESGHLAESQLDTNGAENRSVADCETLESRGQDVFAISDSRSDLGNPDHPKVAPSIPDSDLSDPDHSCLHLSTPELRPSNGTNAVKDDRGDATTDQEVSEREPDPEVKGSWPSREGVSGEGSSGPPYPTEDPEPSDPASEIEVRGLEGASSRSEVEQVSNLGLSAPEGNDVQGSGTGPSNGYGGHPGKKHKDEDDTMPSWRRHKKHFLVLSNAGKPIYSRYGDENKLAGFAGIVQAIMSFVENEGDKIRCIQAGHHQILFLVKGPLYLVSISATGEPTSILKDQLELLHGQIVMILTSAFNRSFARNPKFDMRSLLGGTESVFRHLVRTFSWDYATILKAYSCLRLPSWARRAAGQALSEGATSPKLLFALLLSGEKMVSVAHPKKSPLHSDDIFLLSNFISSSESLRTSESYSPVCLPRYNPDAFLYAYVQFLDPQACLLLLTPYSDGFYDLKECWTLMESLLRNSGALREIVRSADISADTNSSPGGGLQVADLLWDSSRAQSEIASVSSLSGDSWHADNGSDLVGSLSMLEQNPELFIGGVGGGGEGEGLFEQGEDAGFRLSVDAEEGFAGFRRGEVEALAGKGPELGSGLGLGGPGGLQHFLYRNNRVGQYVAAQYSKPLTTRDAQKQLFRAYQRMVASMHGDGGHHAGHKMQYRRDNQNVLLAWRTTEFEIYAAFDSLADKRAAIAVCNRISQWLKSMQGDLFCLHPVILPMKYVVG